jgi:DNA-binding transcriptional LysR family regulator
MFDDLFSKTGISLDRLRSFLEVSRYGGIVQAAKSNPIKQSQLSRQIKELERYFGFELVQRKGKIIVLTEAGKDLSRIIQSQFFELSNFSSFHKNKQLKLIFAGGSASLHIILAKKIESIKKIFLNANIELLEQNTETTLRDIKDMRVDFGFFAHTKNTLNVEITEIGKFEFCFLVPKTILKDKAALNIDKLLYEIPIASMRDSSAENIFKVIEQKRSPIEISMYCTSYLMVRDALESGFYGAILPKLLTQGMNLDKYEEISLKEVSDASRSHYVGYNKKILDLKQITQSQLDSLISVLALN